MKSKQVCEQCEHYKLVKQASVSVGWLPRGQKGKSSYRWTLENGVENKLVWTGMRNGEDFVDDAGWSQYIECQYCPFKLEHLMATQ
jgi:hypothetical protein